MSAIREMFSEALRAGGSRADLIREMKGRGLTILEAIKAARDLFGISLGEAKLLVCSHPDWQNATAAGESLHNELITAFENAEAQNGHRTDAGGLGS